MKYHGSGDRCQPLDAYQSLLHNYPPADNFKTRGSDLVSVCAHWKPECSCQAKVSQLEGIVLAVNQQVLGLQISVQYSAV